MTDAVRVDTGFVEVVGAPLAYDVAGAGPALVLLHEGLADRRMYDDQFGPLAHHHRVVRYDLHGYGRSGTPGHPYTHHEALRELLRHLQIDRATLLGMSLGGSVALDFALTHPQMVDALVLIASGIGGYPLGDETAALAAPIGQAFQAGDFARAIELSVRLWVDGTERRPDEVDPAVRERFRALYTDVLRRSREGGRPAGHLEPPAYRRHGEIRVPTLVVVGTGDIPDVLAQADLLTRSIGGARKVLLPRVAHLLNMEHPTEINRLILGFLADPDDAAASERSVAALRAERATG
jgi:3-oxoadipate enol-lactonase